MSGFKKLSRRGLLVGGAALASASVIRPTFAEDEGSAASAPLGPPPDRWESLRRVTKGALLRPGDADYSQAALPNNLRFRHIRPEAIAPCSSAQMVADVLSWCRDYDMPFVVRGGGHSYSGFSTSHGLVIDMSPMRAIQYDPRSGLVRVEAGATNRELFAAQRQVGRIVTHGRCPTVGIAGFLLGGGVGFNMRRFGVCSDLMTEAEIVTADGALRRLSAEQDADLFWAVRGGGGGNFGVSTSFTLRTQPVDEQLTAFRMVWRDKTLEVAKALFHAAEMAPNGFASRISLGGVTPAQSGKGRQVSVTMIGQFIGDRDGLMAILKPVLDAGPPDFSDIREGGYWEAQEFLMEPGAPAWFRERSTFLPASPDDAFLEAAFDRLRHWPGTGAHGDLFFFQTGGRINEIAPDETAFVHRSSHWLAVVGANWSEDDNARPDITRRAVAWQDDFYAMVGEYGGQGAFQNFADASLVDWRTRYFGANLDRLMAIKAAVDPTNLFRHPQSL
ncbi:FAD-binding oxidoreductase [Kaistia algarum]|uniref:FAD-binding oxidoreductase n=1 Tax=Kaistia algarum TaxID=2083279 RepID=UPI000CE7A3B6|nr:FAD-binding oxidoreductase [Kaistia algarum]MCX5511900.1 FAD-binding oxidoreductase [Kaistia algarum]PPE80035.1 FAD-binding oxidoreductase [Kaistia algarum]